MSLTFGILPAIGTSQSPVQVSLSGSDLTINGQGEVPSGLFGTHAVPLTDEKVKEWGIETTRLIHQSPPKQPTAPGDHPTVPARLDFVLDCLWDRYQPALILTDPDWRETLTRIAHQLGKGAAQMSRGRAVIEFWNEPYLNWASRPGVNYDGIYYDQTRAVEGGPVYLRNEPDPLPWLRWKRGVRIVDPKNRPNYLAWRFAPQNLQPGQTFTFRGETFTAEEGWMVHDITQTDFWSGQQNASFYFQMLEVFARELKQTHPGTVLVAGWGCHLSQGGWKSWDTLYAPLIERFHPWLDGLNEHHYGGDTRHVAADYETVAAYAMTRFGKRLQFYNTEAGGALDPERPDTGPQPEAKGSREEMARAAFTYLMRDVLYLILHSPDKAVTRYAHHSHLNHGDEWAFRLLKPLRGRLMEIQSSSPDLWAVASRQNHRVTVALFNDQRIQSQDVALNLHAPRGTQWTSATSHAVQWHGEMTTLKSNPEPMDSQQTELVIKTKLSPRAAQVWTLELNRTPPAPSIVEHHQFFAAPQRQSAEPDSPLTLQVQLDSSILARARRAKLKTVEVGSGGDWDINGHRLLPVGKPWIQLQEIPLTWLKPETQLIRRAHSSSITVNMASIVLETERETPLQP